MFRLASWLFRHFAVCARDNLGSGLRLFYKYPDRSVWYVLIS